jgi:hypothetical protein
MVIGKTWTPSTEPWKGEIIQSHKNVHMVGDPIYDYGLLPFIGDNPWHIFKNIISPGL